MDNIAKIWDWIVEYGIATEEELQLVSHINGYNIGSMNAVIYARTGYWDREQVIECEGLESEV